jgi:DNA polymerase III epsilon subunit-like protein
MPYNILGELTSQDFIVFDTETTGLDSTSEIVSISFVDYYGEELFSKLVKPMGEISEQAQSIHGISAESVSLCRPFRYWWDFICNKYVNGKVLAGYNVTFDIRMMFQSAAACDPLLSNSRMFSPLIILDVMQLACSVLKLPKLMSLTALCKYMELDAQEGVEGYHGSLFDAQMTAKCLRELIHI